MSASSPILSVPLNKLSFEQFLKILPYLGTILILLGSARLVFFYFHFGVNIVSYLNFSEIITSFLDVIILIIFLGTVLIFFLTQLSSRVFHFFGIIAILSLIYLIMCLINPSKFNLNIAIPMLTLSASVVIFIGVLSKPIETNSIIEILIGIVLTTAGIVWMDINYVKNEKGFVGTTIYLNNDSSIVSNDTIYFIGKTEKYVLVYHENQKATEIIPMERVAKIMIKRKVELVLFKRNKYP